MSKRTKAKNGRTYYGEWIDGAPGNYSWPVRFDVTDGHLGITQRGLPGEDRPHERVLLSPAQVADLQRFLIERK